jgi:hypothetical protein
MTTRIIDLLAAISDHLSTVELPAIASVYVSAWTPQAIVQLACHEHAGIAQGLLAWAQTLTHVSAEVWRTRRGDSVHLSLTGQLPDDTTVRVYGALPRTDHSVGADLPPGTTTPLPLATLHHLATPESATAEATH